MGLVNRALGARSISSRQCAAVDELRLLQLGDPAAKPMTLAKRCASETNSEGSTRMAIKLKDEFRTDTWSTEQRNQGVKVVMEGATFSTRVVHMLGHWADANAKSGARIVMPRAEHHAGSDHRGGSAETGLLMRMNGHGMRNERVYLDAKGGCPGKGTRVTG